MAGTTAARARVTKERISSIKVVTNLKKASAEDVMGLGTGQTCAFNARNGSIPCSTSYEFNNGPTCGKLGGGSETEEVGRWNLSRDASLSFI